MSAGTPARSLRDACTTLSGVPGVVDAAITRDPRDGRARVEVVVGPEYERVPPRVLRLLAECDCGIEDVTTQGDPQHHVVTAV